MLSSRDFCRRSVVFPRLGCNFRFNAHLRDSLNWQNQPEIAPKTAQNNDPPKKAFADLMFPVAIVKNSIVNFTVFFCFKLIAAPKETFAKHQIPF